MTVACECGYFNEFFDENHNEKTTKHIENDHKNASLIEKFVTSIHILNVHFTIWIQFQYVLFFSLSLYSNFRIFMYLRRRKRNTFTQTMPNYIFDFNQVLFSFLLFFFSISFYYTVALAVCHSSACTLPHIQ